MKITLRPKDDLLSFIGPKLRYSHQAIRVFLISVACFLLANILSSPVFANPQEGQVAAGSATITSPDASTVLINQSSDKAIIDWRTFNISPTETTQFIQPAVSSITLNRIDARYGASTILGVLKANGQIWLVNPAGVFFGAGARVDVGGLLATTANITNQDFMNGNYHFIQSPDWNGAIINEGMITVADKGLAALVAPGVANSGIIRANLGTVVLASGNEYTVDLYGDQLIHFGINSTVTKPAVDKDGNVLKDAVSHSGKIYANGGTVLMTAQTAEGVVDHAINMSGYVQAKSAYQKGGMIVLSGGNKGIVQVSGKLNASGKKAGEKGGTVHVLGEQVQLVDSAKIDVSGDQGGGVVLIGGDYQGKNPAIFNAERTFVGSDAIINASAITAGDGGKVIVWANDKTLYYGNIFANAGIESGNGGFVEVSGKEYLDYAGFVDLGAPSGEAGTLLLDPKNITIQTSSGSAYSNGVNNLFANNASGDTILTPASLNVNANITLQANTDVTFAENVSKTNNGRTLTVQAGRSIIINSGVSVSTNNGAITMTANSSAAQSVNRDAGLGSISMASGSSLSSGNAAIGLTVGNLSGSFTPGDITVNNLTTTGNNAVTITTPGAVTVNGTISSGSGTTTISANTDGSGADSFVMGSSGAITTTNTTASAVAINVNAAAGGTGSATLGNITKGSGGTISVLTNVGGNTTGGSITQNSGTTLSTGTGAITLRVPDAGSSSIGTSGANIMTTSTGTLNLTAGSGGAFVTNTGNLTLGIPTLNANSPLSVISSGTLTLPAASISTGTGDLTLRSNGGALATIATRTLSTTSGALTLFGNTNLTLNSNVSTTGGTMNLTANTGTLTIATGISANSGGGPINIAANNITLTGTGAINSGSGDTTVNAVGSIGLGATAGTMTISGTELQNITAANLILNAGNNTNITVNGISAANSTNVNLATLNTTGTGTIAFNTGASTFKSLTANSQSTISQNAALTILSGGTLTTSSVGGTTLNSANSIPTFNATNITSGNISLTNSGALSISGIAQSGGNLTINNTGSIAQTGAISVSGISSFTAGANAIDLSTNGASNAFTGAVSLNNSGANNVSLRNNIALVLGTSSVGSGTLSLISNGGISQTGAITQAASAGTVTLTTNAASSDIALNTQANDFSGAIAFGGTLSNIRDFGLRNTNSGASLPTLSGLTNLRHLTVQFDNAAVSLPAATLTSSGNLTVTSNGSITQTGALTVPGTSTFSVTALNSDILLNTQANDFGSTAPVFSGTLTNIRDVAFRNTNASAALPSFTGLTNLRNLTIEFNNAPITINSAITVSGSGNAIVLSTGNSFVNNVGAAAFVFIGGGKFQIWSVNPASDTRNGLIYNFKQYNATYGVTTVLGTGNGFLYTLAPSITPALTGTVTKTYDGGTTATLAAGNYTSSGAVDGDTITFNNPTSGSYDNKNVGSGKNVSVSGIAIDSASNGLATVYGYQLASSTANANIGVINPAAITISSNTGQSKIYGDDDPNSAKTAYGVTSGTLYDTLTGDMGRVAGEAVGSYNFTQNTVTVSDGNSGNNYTITFNGTTNKFQITTKSLTGTVANQSKTYGANDPLLAGISVNLGGVVNRNVTDINGNVTAINDTSNVATTLALLTRDAGETVGSYNITAAGFNVLTGTAAGNYSAPTFTGTPTLTINKANLTAELTNPNQNKVYGANDPALAGIGGTLSGVINNPAIVTWNGLASINDTGNVTATTSSLTRAVGENVGDYNITAGVFALGGSAAGNYNNPTLTIGNSPKLTISAANLTGSIANQSKMYGSNDPSLSGIGVTLGGVINNPAVVTWNGNVSINDTGNVGTSLTSLTRAAGETIASYNITAGTFNSLTGSASGNYNAPSFTGTPTLTITKADLTGTFANQSKVYGTSDPAVSGITLVLNGVVNNNVTDWMGTVTPINDTGNVTTSLLTVTRNPGESVPGSPYSYTAATFNALTGSAAGNYNAPSFSIGPTLTITPATLTASQVFANNKLFNGSTVATLNLASAILAGIISGDDVQVNTSSYNANFINSAIGNNVPVIVTNLQLTGSAASNYVLTQPTGLAANILPSSQGLSDVIQFFVESNAQQSQSTQQDLISALSIHFPGISLDNSTFEVKGGCVQYPGSAISICEQSPGQ